MWIIRVWLARLRGFFGGARRDAALVEEINTHLDLLADDLHRRGLTTEEARAAARRAFGGIDQMKERYRDQRGLPSIDSLWQDARVGFRALTAQPGVAALIAGALGLGIGVSMAFVTIVNAFCLRGLPIDDPDRVLFVSSLQGTGAPGGLSQADFAFLQDHAPAFARLAAYSIAGVTVADDQMAPDRISAAYMSASAFPILGAHPILGRVLSAEDDRTGAPLAVIISASLWEAKYAGDPGVLRRAIRVDGSPATIVGVIGDGFKFPGQADLWLPSSAMPGFASQPATARTWSVVGRLTNGATLDSARDELAAAAARLDENAVAGAIAIRFVSVPINERFNGNIRDPTWKAFLTAGLLVLIVSCANVANVLLMRASQRAREMALRLSLGATRGRLVRQLAVESAMLAGLGGLVGLGLALAGVRLLAWSVPASAPLPYWISFGIDGRVLAAFVAICTLSVFLFGWIPALVASRAQANDLLKDGGRQTPAHLRTRWWTSAFLAIELALTVVLLSNVVLGLALAKPEGAGIDIDPAPLLTARIALPASSYPTPEARDRFYTRLDQQLAALDGVLAHTTAAQVPRDPGRVLQLTLAGRAAAASDSRPNVRAVAVGPHYFETLGVPLAAGRDLESDDGQRGHAGVVVNQHFVERFVSAASPIGQRLQLTAPNGAPTADDWAVIIGVAPDIRDVGPRPDPIVYQLDRASAPASAALIVRASLSPEALIPVVRRAVTELDPNLPLARVLTMEQAISDAGWNGRVSAGILNTISTIAFLLALVGLYAVTAHLVVRRTQEISVRIALGATPAAIRWLVLRRALWHVALGLTLGLPATVAFLRAFGSPTPKSAPWLEALILLPVGAAVVVIALIACLVPAVRASRVEPLAALRSQ